MDSVSVKVRRSNVHGRGVFALQDIKAGYFACIYDGELLSKDVIKNSSAIVDESYCLPHLKYPKQVLCGYKYPKNNVGVGQLINDAKTIQLQELDYKHGIEACR